MTLISHGNEGKMVRVRNDTRFGATFDIVELTATANGGEGLHGPLDHESVRESSYERGNSTQLPPPREATLTLLYELALLNRSRRNLSRDLQPYG